MKQSLTLNIPSDVYQTLTREATKTGKSLEEIALSWIIHHSRLGRVETLMPSYGAWKMAPEERTQIERLIDAERHVEEN